MKITVLQENLARGLGIVSRAVSPRGTLPVLANILIASGFDLPGVPWALYITDSGISIHGTYWRSDYGLRVRMVASTSLPPPRAGFTVGLCRVWNPKNNSSLIAPLGRERIL